MSTMVNPRSITDAERPWLEAWSLDTQAFLIRELRARHSAAIAHGVAGWLTMKAVGEDEAPQPTKARYRQVLDELAGEGITPPPAKRRRDATVVAIGSARRGRRTAKVPDEGIPGYRKAPRRPAPAFTLTTLREAA